MRTRLFGINCERRNPDAHPYEHCDATNGPRGSLTHS
jgi:hypothetical protein